MKEQRGGANSPFAVDGSKGDVFPGVPPRLRALLGASSLVLGLMISFGSSALADDCGDGTGLDGAYACGAGANASDSPANSAFGNNSTASSDGGNTAVGAAATAALGANNTALGYNAVAAGNNATALGQGANASFDGSTAVGQGVATTRDNQVAIGGSQATYTLSGLPSAASTSAQSGTTYVVTTDSAGNLAASTFDFEALSDTVAQNSSDISALQGTVSGHTAELADHETRITNNESDIAQHTTQIASLDTRVTTNTADIATNTSNIAINTADIATNTANIATNTNNIALLDGRVGSLESGLDFANNRIDKAFEGTAMALAMAGSGLPGDKNYAVSLNWGTFEGENAFAGSAQARINENVILSGGIGMGASNHTVGGRAGVTVAW
ncbi:YadA-like family protein [Mesorhizobium sp. ES1-1]|uniref:YadA-like family protein n=1 Tax=Mesorhizobium sp. ES1-1 TaxID=2876629 RepID=UPI001CCF45F7|nr:YadA-like family protein [Mesorhizobium sp. ES1-1]MBZ9678654.1 YadA-like family protein [Mesorhizobium sp. ES1-1]